MRRAVLSGRFGWGGEHRPHLTLSVHLRSEVRGQRSIIGKRES